MSMTRRGILPRLVATRVHTTGGRLSCNHGTAAGVSGHASALKTGIHTYDYIRTGADNGSPTVY